MLGLKQTCRLNQFEGISSEIATRGYKQVYIWIPCSSFGECHEFDQIKFLAFRGQSLCISAACGCLRRELTMAWRIMADMPRTWHSSFMHVNSNDFIDSAAVNCAQVSFYCWLGRHYTVCPFGYDEIARSLPYFQANKCCLTIAWRIASASFIQITETDVWLSPWWSWWWGDPKSRTFWL